MDIQIIQEYLCESRCKLLEIKLKVPLSKNIINENEANTFNKRVKKGFVDITYICKFEQVRLKEMDQVNHMHFKV